MKADLRGMGLSAFSRCGSARQSTLEKALKASTSRVLSSGISARWRVPSTPTCGGCGWLRRTQLASAMKANQANTSSQGRFDASPKTGMRQLGDTKTPIVVSTV